MEMEMEKKKEKEKEKQKQKEKDEDSDLSYFIERKSRKEKQKPKDWSLIQELSLVHEEQKQKEKEKEKAGGQWIPEPKWGHDLMGRPLVDLHSQEYAEDQRLAQLDEQELSKALQNATQLDKSAVFSGELKPRPKPSASPSSAGGSQM